MRIKIIVPVTSTTLVDDDARSSIDGITVGFLHDKSHRLTHIFAEGPHLGTMPSVSPGTNGVKLQIDGGNPSTARLEEAVNYLGSVGAFWWGIRDVAIRDMKIEYVPEDEAEQDRLALLSFSTTKSFRREPQYAPSHQLQDIFKMQEAWKYITVPMSFYREGNVEFENFRFKNAFINYFFMLEGLYGDGKSGKKDQINALLGHGEVCSAVEAALAAIERSGADKHIKRIDELLQQYNYEKNCEGVVSLIVHTRGMLSHFYIKSSQHQGTPLNQGDFFTEAFLLQAILIQIHNTLHFRAVEEVFGAKS